MVDITKFDPNSFKSPAMQSIGAGSTPAQRAAAQIKTPQNVQQRVQNRIPQRAPQAAAQRSMSSPAPSMMGARARGFVRGVDDAATGLAGGVLSLGEKVGAVAPGTTRAFDEGQQDNRLFEDTYKPGTPERSAFEMARVFGETAPVLLTPGGASGGILKRATTGLLGGAFLGGTKYAKDDTQRGANTLLGGIIGGAIPALAGGLSRKARLGKVAFDAARGKLDGGVAKAAVKAFKQTPGTGKAAAMAGKIGARTAPEAVKDFTTKKFVAPTMEDAAVAERATTAVDPMSDSAILARHGVTADEVNSRMREMVADIDRRRFGPADQGGPLLDLGDKPGKPSALQNLAAGIPAEGYG